MSLPPSPMQTECAPPPPPSHFSRAPRRPSKTPSSASASISSSSFSDAAPSTRHSATPPPRGSSYSTRHPFRRRQSGADSLPAPEQEQQQWPLTPHAPGVSPCTAALPKPGLRLDCTQPLRPVTAIDCSSTSQPPRRVWNFSKPSPARQPHLVRPPPYLSPSYAASLDDWTSDPSWTNLWIMRDAQCKPAVASARPMTAQFSFDASSARPHIRSRTASFKAALSFTNTRLSTDLQRRPGAPFAPASPSPLSPASSHRKSYSFPKRPSATSTTTSMAPAHARSPSLYYNDPDARRKLKDHLASPQSFEDALAHGFPSASPLNAGPPQLPAIPGNDMHAFFTEDSFWDNLDDLSRSNHDRHRMSDDSSDTERDSPVTPVEYHAISSDTPQFAPIHKAWDADMFGDRQMTMHLTLTKPAFRGEGEGPYRAYVRRGHPTLPAASPITGDGDAPTLESTLVADSDHGKVRGLWRKLKTRR